MNYVTVGVDLGATYRRGPVFRGTCLTFDKGYSKPRFCTLVLFSTSLEVS